ncbi:MAG: hypothetical protein FIA92_12040, partial [Chloroflexi bacterium]|nr:hypothetical protein [Chloroflexota bacterium]
MAVRVISMLRSGSNGSRCLDRIAIARHSGLRHRRSARGTPARTVCKAARAIVIARPAGRLPMAAVENRPKRRPAARGASKARSNGSTRAANGSGGAGPTDDVAKASPARLRARRFDADRLDRELDLERALAARPSARQLLWIDAGGEISAKRLTDIAKRFGLEDETTAALQTPLRRPHVAVHGSYFHVSVATPRNGPGTDTDTWLDIVVGERIVLTRHPEPIRILDDLDERVQRDTTLGAVHGARFVALVLDAVVTSYFEAVDAIEDEIDVLDTRSLRDTRGRDLLNDLVALRRRIARLRRSMVAHRGVYGAL